MVPEANNFVETLVLLIQVIIPEGLERKERRSTLADRKGGKSEGVKKGKFSSWLSWCL